MQYSNAMTNTIWILLALFAGIVLLMWKRRAGKSLDELLSDAGAEHMRVHDVLARHPEGSAWREYQQRLES